LKVVKKQTHSKGFLPGSIAMNQEDEAENDQKESVETFDKTSEEFKKIQPPDPKVIGDAWSTFIQSIQDEYPELKSLLLLLSPDINDDMELVVEVRNQLQRDKVEEHKGKLIPFLRDKLNNRFLTLKVVVNTEKVETAKPVSPADKLKFMSEKNPHILDLQKKFGLEPEY
jgi:hypothetical protein